MPRPTLEKPNPKLVKIPGRRKYYIRWTENRRSKVASTGTESEAEAEQCLNAFVASINALPDQPTISDLLDLRLKARGPYVANVKNLTTFAKPLKKYFGHYQPHQVTPAVQAGYIGFRGGKIPTVKRELEELRAALAVVDDPPKIIIPKAAPPRERFLSQEEGKRLADCAGAAHIRLFILIGLSTGARKGAILGLTWDRVDLKHRRIDFRDPEKRETKKRRGVVRISPELVAALRDQKQFARTKNVIEFHGKPVGDIRYGFRLAAERAEVPWATAHIMKHSVISWLAEDGFTIDQIADFTATNRQTVDRIYRKFNPDYLSDLAESLSKKVFAPTPLALTNSENG
jgi:integrase